MSKNYVITRIRSQQIGFLLEDDRLVEVHPAREQPSLLGGIFVGKVRQIVRNIDAAFVEIAGGQTCFLPLAQAVHPILANRPSDGRLLAGDEVLVQVKKDAVKTKDPVLSANLSVTGHLFGVQIGTENGIRYSKKLTNGQRERIDQALKQLFVPAHMTLIVRTGAGEITDPEALINGARRQIQRAEHLLQVGKTRTVFSLLTERHPDSLRPLFDGTMPLPDRIVTDDREVYTAVSAYLKETGCPAEAKLYQDEKIPLPLLYGLEGKLREAVLKKVWLPSGGYLVIEPVEALTVIDVNTGKYTGNRQTEETFRLINREAAAETARQLRLRNLSGIILVDFINMKNRQDNRELLLYFRDLCRQDPVPAKVIDMTPLGLVEVTRQKRERTLAELLAKENGANEISGDGEGTGRQVSEEL